VTSIILHEGDNRAHLRRLIDQGVRVNSVVTDAPYGLVSVAKRFGKAGAAPAKFGSDGAFQRASGGFMGSKWDATGIERDPEFWRLIHDILLPGGYCIAFGSPRTGHWMACAMEMGGFVMHPFLGWLYGQGMPKGYDAAKYIEKAGLGAEVAEFWQGWKYGTQSMKPGLEPIYVGQRPFAEKNGALNLLRHGAGAINIDGCRVAHQTINGGNLADNPHLRDTKLRAAPIATSFGRAGDEVTLTSQLGRHPANFLHDASPEVLALFPSAPGQIAPSSSSNSRKNQTCYGEMRRGSPDNVMHPRARQRTARPASSTPSSARTSSTRFFNAFQREDELDALLDAGLIAELDGAPVRYNAKATARDRIFQCRICGDHGVGAKPGCGCIDPETGEVSLRSHPTAKPIDMLAWLVRLVTPPGGTVLDPFAGTGPTGAAARAEGVDCILMEAEPEFAGDIRARFGVAAPALDLGALLGPPPAAAPASLAALLG
jgi:site-specific DNA-methyltransferase (adenine-specific)